MAWGTSGDMRLKYCRKDKSYRKSSWSLQTLRAFVRSASYVYFTYKVLTEGKLDSRDDVDFSGDEACHSHSDEKATQCELTDGQKVENTTDSSVVTDICNDADLPEVEILSLIEEQIPRYRLRADTITDFAGYGHQDWIQTPVLPQVDDADLTPELVEETLKYFILCSDRVTQMTKTYNDIEAVTRLLEEKERDLELAAKIGQTLLDKNKYFEEKNEHLEELVNQAHERINQLKHDLSMKDELLKIYTQNYEGSDPSSSENGTPDGANMPHLQKKIENLQDENLHLHLETSKLKAATDTLEEREQKLVSDYVHQFEDLNEQLRQFAKELIEKTEECSTSKEEITNLLHQIVIMQKRTRTLTAENMELQKTLEAAHDSQNYLTREIADLKEKNEELLALLEETQEELRRFRNKDRPNALRHNYMSSLLSTTGESLASELENSLRSELDMPRGYSPMDRRKHTWKIFETAKAAKSAGNQSASSSCSASVLGASLMDESKSVSQRSSMYFSDTESGVGEGTGSELDSLYGVTHKLGRPGIPGSNDLQTALRRLSLRRANELNEMDYAKEERERQERETHLRERTVSELTEQSDTESATPARCHTPESMMSANSGYMSMTGSNNYYKMPEKLRIVKPLEGSITLRQWQRLATPHLGGIFEARPGVQVKGEKKLDLEPEVYTLSDYEEDDELMDYPSRFQESSGVYTLTDSRVQHPSEAARISSSYSSSTPRMAPSSQGSYGGTSTFSMSLGLASILNERDLLKTPPEGSAAERPPFQVNRSSNPARFPSLVSDTHYHVSSGLSSPATTLTLPTNSYNLIPSPCTWSERSERGQGHVGMTSRSLTAQVSPSTLGSQSATENISDVHVPNLFENRSTKDTMRMSTEPNALGMINTLKSTGFSLYEYLSGGGKSDGRISNESAEKSRPNSLPIHTTGTCVSIATSNSGSSVAMAIGGDNSNIQVTAGGSVPDMGKKSHLASILSRKTAGSVIGAFTNYNRDRPF